MAEHARDTQAEAFRGAGPDDWVTDDDLAAMHDSGELQTVTDAPVRTVYEHEVSGWDAERVGPKSLEQAKAALADRVDDPQAPDDDASLYDGLDSAAYPGGR